MQLGLYSLGVFYLVLSISVIAVLGINAEVPLYCVGRFCSNNNATTGIVFSILFLFLVRRDGWRGVFGTILAGALLDLYWSMASSLLQQFYWWSYPVWAVMIASSLWFARPWKFKVLNYPMFLFLVAFFVGTHITTPPSLYFLGPLVWEVPYEILWCVAFVTSVRHADHEPAS